MIPFVLWKREGSRVIVQPGTIVYANSSYELTVVAQEFASHREDSATFDILQDNRLVSSCPLVVDPLRRSTRHGRLRVGDIGGETTLRIVLGDSTLVSHPLRVVRAEGESETPDTPAGSRWSVVDLGVVDTGRVQVQDLTQVKFTVSGVAPYSLDVSAPTVPFEAYVVIMAPAAGRFPFEGITVNGEVPFWDHRDSLALGETQWVLRLVSVAGVIHADLRAGRPAGTERDLDGDLVTSVEVQ